MQKLLSTVPLVPPHLPLLQHWPTGQERPPFTFPHVPSVDRGTPVQLGPLVGTVHCPPETEFVPIGQAKHVPPDPDAYPAGQLLQGPPRPSLVCPAGQF